MPHAAPSPLAQELATSHALMMQCGAAALHMLERAGAAGGAPFDMRAGDEAVRMAGLSARLMGHHGEGLRLLRRLPDRGESVVPAATPASQPDSASASKPASAAAVRKCHADPGASRGRLKNGNPSGDYLKSPRCGARTRSGGCCRQPAMRNGRCRMHGGLSTGPRTTEGLARCRTTRLVHGYRAAAHIGLRRRAAHAARRLCALTAQLRSSAGHGLHRPDSPTRVEARCARPPSSAGVPSTHGSRPNDPRARAARPYSKQPNGAVSAGHGVHRPDSVHHRGHREHRAGMTTHCAHKRSIDNPPSVPSVSSVVNPSAAWHGVRRSIRDSLRSSVSLAPTQPMRNFVLQSAAALR
jgi:hypothetical protein